jgi:hypothetical protein
MRRQAFLAKLAAMMDDTNDPWAALGYGIAQPNHWDQLAGLTGTAGTGLGLYGAYHLGAARPSTPAALGAAAAAARNPEMIGAFRSVNPGAYRWARAYEQQIMAQQQAAAQRAAAQAHAGLGGLPVPDRLRLSPPDPTNSWKNVINAPPVVDPIVEPPVVEPESPIIDAVVEPVGQSPHAARTMGNTTGATRPGRVPLRGAQSPIWQNLKGRWNAMRGGPRAALLASLASIPLSMMFRNWATQTRQSQMQEMLKRVQERDAMLQYLLMQQAQAQANKSRGLLSWLFG